VGQLAVAEAGQRSDDDALWHWQVAQAMGWHGDLSSYGPPGELLSRSPARRVGEAPPGLPVRREGDGGSPLISAHRLSGEEVKVPGGWRTFPLGIRVEVIVDANGRVRQPVVLASTFSALTYKVLEAMRGWRFAPAQAGGEPVASFYDLRLPDARPLERIVEFGQSPLARPLELLKSGRYREADEQLDKLWARGLNDAEQKASFLGVVLALRALAAAGLGRNDQAICRFEAAQTLEPRLYGAELTAFGAPGALLASHPWSAPQKECGQGPASDLQGATCCDQALEEPRPVSRRAPVFPAYVRSSAIPEGLVTLVIASVLNEAGVLRDVVLQEPGPSANLDASALDAVCDWRFQPATLKGKPIKIVYVLSVNFQIPHRFKVKVQ
jgi:TonB family protein